MKFKDAARNNYVNVHIWLSYHFGQASMCENPNCTYENPKRYEWAHIHDKPFGKYRDSFKQLCPSCHRKYDMPEEFKAKISSHMKGNKHHTRSVVLNKKHHYNTITEGAKATGASITSIANNLAGRSKSTKVGIWEYNNK